MYVRLHLQRSTDSRAAGTSGVGGSRFEQERVLWCVAALHEVYLARSLSRLNEPLQMMFPRQTSSLSSSVRAKAVNLIKGSDGAGAAVAEEEYPEPPSHASVSLLVKGK